MAGDFIGAEQDLAPAQLENPDQALEQGALARAVGPYHRDDLALTQRDADVADDRHAAITRRDSLGPEDRRGSIGGRRLLSQRGKRELSLSAVSRWPSSRCRSPFLAPSPPPSR